MNRILLRPEELDAEHRCRFAAGEYRAQHLQKILGAKPGQDFEAGILGTRRTGRLQLISDLTGDLELQFCGAESEEEASKQRHGLRMVLGLMRPPVLRRLLRDLASAGVEEIVLLQAELCEGDYSKSRIWEDLERYLVLGAEQGRINRLPRLLGERGGISVQNFLTEREPKIKGILLDDCSGHHRENLCGSCYVAVGPERGWTPAERKAFLKAGFLSYLLGPFTLRTELAAHAALALYLMH